ncbi:MAG: hypothetical protein ACYCQJ_02330 [Nitrososphaerales archaeon]
MSSWGNWGNKIARASRPKKIPSQSRVLGIDIVGYGPIGRELSRRLALQPQKYNVTSIADSSSVIYPKDSAQVLEIAKWKGESNKLVDFKGDAKISAKDDLLQGLEFSSASLVVDVTNSDYTKSEEARKRAIASLSAGKHFVAANKVALAFHYGEVFDLAKKKGLKIGYGATIIGGRSAIAFIETQEESEVKQVNALLNSATTMILSSLQSDPLLSIEEAISHASKEGVLERDPSIDLDGWDAAAKTAILSNCVFKEKQITINDVQREGIQGDLGKRLVEEQRKDPSKKVVRLVSEITKESALVEPRLVDSISPLGAGGHSGVVVFQMKDSEVSIRSTYNGSGVDVTSSVLLADISRIASQT